MPDGADRTDTLRPREALDVWIASIVTRPDPQGTSVLELLTELESVIESRSTRQALREMTLTIGGSALEEDDCHRFDRNGALQSFVLIDLRALPRLKEPLPDAIVAATLTVRCRDLDAPGRASDALTHLISSS